ncbi:hypothetical protein MKW98_001362 [Papaver atlanticum]|uniref:DUF4216 domain-containing protein n=1 Tax=Papaver atlanticum TaxID=357466 RepID=A0AAD4STJ8_9MAGN|nr:hypothetical protein MKW98_001362 [Papaver atlanticum]
MDAFTSFRESSKDTNLVDDDSTYYDFLQDIFEVDYGVFREVIFDYTKLRFVNFKKFMKNSREVDEPFIHASQARQVFYCRDVKRQHWNLVLESLIRSDPNKNAYEDPFVFTGAASEAPSISATVGDVEYWNGDAQVNDEYLDEDFQGTT